MTVPSISYSALDTYQRCPRKYRLSYVDKISRRKFESSATSMGTAVHNGISYALMMLHSGNYVVPYDELRAALMQFYTNWYDTNELLLDQQDEHFDQKRADLIVMVADAFEVTCRTLVEMDVWTRWRTVELNGQPLIEARLSVPADDDTEFHFQVDWVALNLEDNQVYLIDWKTRQNFQQTEDEALIIADNFNTQISLYQVALQHLGVEVTYTMTYQIAPFAPKRPAKLLKENRMSRSRIKTDWETYAAAVLAIGDDPNDPYYDDVRVWAQDVKWFSPLVAHRSLAEIHSRWNTMLIWLQRIKAEKTEYESPYGNNAFPMVESAMCRYCPFNRLCFAEVRGFDVQSLIDLEYNYKTELIYETEPE